MNLILSSTWSIPRPMVGVRAGTWSWVNTRQIVCCYVVSTAPYLGTCGLVDDLSQHQFGPNFWNSSPDAAEMIDDALFNGFLNECEYSLTWGYVHLEFSHFVSSRGMMRGTSMQSTECGKTVEQILGAHFLYRWKGLINVLTLVEKQHPWL